MTAVHCWPWTRHRQTMVRRTCTSCINKVKSYLLHLIHCNKPQFDLMSNFMIQGGPRTKICLLPQAFHSPSDSCKGSISASLLFPQRKGLLILQTDGGGSLPYRRLKLSPCLFLFKFFFQPFLTKCYKLHATHREIRMHDVLWKINMHAVPSMMEIKTK